MFQLPASAGGWIDIVKEAADPALYPSVLGSALQQLNRLTIYIRVADAGDMTAL
jgi:hypothetical protein